MYLRASVSNPYTPNLAINKSWFNLSKYFERPMKIALIYPPLSKNLFHNSSIQLKQCCVLRFVQNPVSCFDNLSFMYSGVSLSRTRKGPTNLFKIEKVRDREIYRENQNFYL